MRLSESQRLHCATRLFIVGTILLLISGRAHADSSEIPPPPAHYVYDEADWLSPAQERSLADSLQAFERSTSNQLVVAIFRSLHGQEIQDYTHRVAEAWGMGRKGRDNGILLAIYSEDRKIRIEVGYGLEGAVTDAISFSIIQNEMRPRLQAGHAVAAVWAGSSALMAASRGEYEGSGKTLGDRQRGRSSRGLPLPILFLLLFIFLRVIGRGGRRRGGPFIFFGGGGRGGGFGGGGFGGGGFIGGGGGFGGGGASGGW